MDEHLTIDWDETAGLTSQLGDFVKQARPKNYEYEIHDKIDNRFLVLDRTMGGMSNIYFCFDLDLQDLCTRALKTISNFSLLDREKRAVIDRETKIWISLGHHPNIVKCHMLLPVMEKPFILLEWIAAPEGAPTELSSWLYHHKPDLDTQISIAHDIAKGMAYANQISPGIVHRDLKPGNILIDQDQTAKITDFGIANILEVNDDKSPNSKNGVPARINDQAYTLIGSPLYMAPEQWAGQVLDQRTDIYGFGCILYEMLASRLLYTGLMEDLREKHLHGEIPKLDDHIPEDIKVITYKCLQKNPVDRFQTFSELEAALSALRPEVEAKTNETEHNAFYYGNQALTYINLGDYEQAQAFFDKAFELDPHLTRAYNNRGIMFWKMERFDDAIKDFSKAIELDPDFGEAYANRSALYGELKNHEPALADANRAIELAPNILSGWSNRAIINLALKNFEAGLVDADRAILLSQGRDPNQFFTKAELLLGLKRYKESLAIYEQQEQETKDEMVLAKIWYRKLKPLVKVDEARAIELGKDIMASMSKVFPGPESAMMIGNLFMEVEAYQAALPFYFSAMKAGSEEGTKLAKECVTHIAKNQNLNEDSSTDPAV